jgi:Raf kinase inhibitor-like YbhB/YbcL family protein
MSLLTVKSQAFEHTKKIPPKYTCDQTGTNPPLSISGVPNTAKSLALIMDDPDATTGTFVHWIMWNISPQTSEIKEDTAIGVEGLNSMGKAGYTPPCPPFGIHRYFFKIYALDCELSLSRNSKKQDLEVAMQGHIIEKAELIGLYSR